MNNLIEIHGMNNFKMSYIIILYVRILTDIKVEHFIYVHMSDTAYLNGV